MASHEVVIRLGRPFGIQVNGRFVGNVREITIPFNDATVSSASAATAAAAEVQVSVRLVNDAGGEDYRPVVSGEILRVQGELEQ